MFRLGLGLKMRFIAISIFWNISKKSSYIVGNKKFFGKICIFNLRKIEKVSLQK